MLDGLRFTLPTARERLLWSTTCGWAYRVVFGLAERSGDPRLVAALVESARTSGVPATGTDRALDTVLPAAAEPAGPPPGASQLGPVATYSGPAALGGELALDPPPVVVLPWGAGALAEHLPAAERQAGRALRVGRVPLTSQLRP